MRHLILTGFYKDATYCGAPRNETDTYVNGAYVPGPVVRGLDMCPGCLRRWLPSTEACRRFVRESRQATGRVRQGLKWLSWYLANGGTQAKLRGAEEYVRLAAVASARLGLRARPDLACEHIPAPKTRAKRKKR